jgi:hypothetical protein
LKFIWSLAFSFTEMKTLTMLISFLVSMNIYAQKGKLLVSSWNSDGNDAGNIPVDKYFYYERGDLYYFLSNDNNSFYIDMKIEDKEVQQRILNQGIIIWVNMDNKPAKKMGIHFPLGSQNSINRRKSEIRDNLSDADGTPVSPVSKANTIELIGFSGEEGKRFPSENAENFRGYVSYDKENILHYRMIMPVAKLPVRNSKDGHGAMPVTFGIEYGQTSGKPAFNKVLLWIKDIKLASKK